MSIPRFLRPRFSLKLLLLAMTAACLFIGHWVTSAKRQKQAVDAIVRDLGFVRYDFEEAGARQPPEPEWLLDRLGVDYWHSVVRANINGDDKFFQVIDDLPRLRILGLVPTENSYASFTHLRHLNRLESLAIAFVRLSPDSPRVERGLDQLGTRTTLKQLAFTRAALPPEGLSCLAGLKNLESLTFHEMRLRGEDIGYMAALPKLQKLTINGVTLDENAVARFGELKQVTELDLTQLPLGNGRLRYLAGMTSLRRLKLTNTGVQADDLKHLIDLPKLTSLFLSDTRVDERAFNTFQQMPALEELKFAESFVSLPKLAELQALLPNCRINSR